MKLIFDEVVHIFIMKLVLQELIAEFERSAQVLGMDKHMIRARCLLEQFPLQIACCIAVVVPACTIVSLSFELLEPVKCCDHALSAKLFEHFVVLLNDDLDGGVLVVIDELIGLTSLTQVVAPWEPLVNSHAWAGVQIQILA